MTASTLLVGNLSPYPIDNGGGVLQTAGGNGNFPGPASGYTAIGSLTATNPTYAPTSSMWVVGYLDGSGHMHLSYADNSSNAVAYPKLVSITQIFQTDSAGNSKAGAFKVALSPGTNSPEQSSPLNVFLDQDAILIFTTNTQYG